MLKTVSTANGLVSPTFSGNVTLSNGNLVQGTAAKGINFTANTPAAGMTSQLLNWYEEGTWTPDVTAFSGTITTVGAVSGKYTRVGRLVTLTGTFAITLNGTGSVLLQLTGMPFVTNSPANIPGTGVSSTSGKQLIPYYNTAAAKIYVSYSDGTYPGANLSNYAISITYEIN